VNPVNTGKADTITNSKKKRDSTRIYKKKLIPSQAKNLQNHV